MLSTSTGCTNPRRAWIGALAVLVTLGLIGLVFSFRNATVAQAPSQPGALASAKVPPARSELAGEVVSPAIGAKGATQPTHHFTALFHQDANSLEARGNALARTNPAAAFRQLDGFDTQDRVEWTRGIFKALAQSDAAWALAYARQLPPSPERRAALTSLLEGWGYDANESPEQQARRSAAFGPDADLGLFLLEGESPRPDLAVVWAEQLASGQGRTQLLGQAAVMQAPTDPTLALSYGSGLEGDDRLAFDAMMVRGWTRQQPDEAWQWSSSLADPVQREEMQALSISELGQMDPSAAAARLALLPPDDDSFRQQALAEVAACYARQNASNAMAWAQTLPPNDQEAAQESIHRQVMAGMGL